MNRLALLPLLALAACQGAPKNDTDAADVQNQLDAPIKEVETLPPGETAVDAGSINADNVAVAEPAGKLIPASMQGKWGQVPADCTSTKGDNKGLMTVTSDMMRFYESRAKLMKIVGSSPEKLTAEFAFTGEGQNWTQTETLTLTGSSNTLTRSEDGTDLRYTRCPAA